VSTNVHHWPLSWASWIQSSTPRFCNFLKLSFHIRLIHPRGLFLCVFLLKVWAHLFHLACALYCLDFITLTLLCKQTLSYMSAEKPKTATGHDPESVASICHPHVFSCLPGFAMNIPYSFSVSYILGACAAHRCLPDFILPATQHVPSTGHETLTMQCPNLLMYFALLRSKYFPEHFVFVNF
jgi:hypothetical protein